jgi:hypothetical protein
MNCFQDLLSTSTCAATTRVDPAQPPGLPAPAPKNVIAMGTENFTREWQGLADIAGHVLAVARRLTGKTMFRIALGDVARRAILQGLR